MKVRAATVDDLLHEVFRRVLSTGRVVVATKKKNLEKTGAVLELSNPRARMSRTEARCLLFSALGELLWYLSGSNELSFIRYYVEKYPEDGPGVATVRAAYGPRLVSSGTSRIDWVIDLLKIKPSSRRAVIPIYEPADCKTELPEVPCTCTLQFLLRETRLELLVYMRSNDAFLGLPGDVFAFTMIQELVARALGVEVGRYKHLVGSLHLYEQHWRKAKHFIDEGWQSKASMPVMPRGDQRRYLSDLLQLEKGIRLGEDPAIPHTLPEYWRDLAYLLKIYRADQDKATAPTLKRLRKQITSPVYGPYIDKRQRSAERRDMEIPVPTERALFPESTGVMSEN